MKRNIVALIYDFDKTLTDKDMQDYGFIPSLGMTPEDFWRDCNNMAHEKKMDGILAMMYFMIERARGKSVLTADTLKELGKDVNYYPGVTEWFDAVNEYGKSKGVVIEHYIISSGLKKIIEGTEIAKNFCEIFASEFVYDEYGVPYWPAVALNYTSKIQFLYRINKGIFDVSDDKNLNDSMEERNRRIPEYEGNKAQRRAQHRRLRRRAGKRAQNDESRAHQLYGESRLYKRFRTYAHRKTHCRYACRRKRPYGTEPFAIRQIERKLLIFRLPRRRKSAFFYGFLKFDKKKNCAKITRRFR